MNMKLLIGLLALGVVLLVVGLVVVLLTYLLIVLAEKLWDLIMHPKELKYKEKKGKKAS